MCFSGLFDPSAYHDELQTGGLARVTFSLQNTLRPSDLEHFTLTFTASTFPLSFKNVSPQGSFILSKLCYPIASQSSDDWFTVYRAVGQPDNHRKFVVTFDLDPSIEVSESESVFKSLSLLLTLLCLLVFFFWFRFA